jgi:hypothetical protein
VGAASNPAAAEEQVKDQNYQQNSADTDSTAVTITPIPETAAEQEQEYQDNQDQVHGSLHTTVGLRCLPAIQLPR